MPRRRIADHLICLLVACGGNDRLPVHVATAHVPSDAAAITIDAEALVALPPGMWRHDQIAATDHVCALRGDRVMCWGTNSFGEVGDEPRTPHAVPILVPHVEHVASIAVGPSMSCAVGSDGHVTCWGSYDAAKWAPRRIDGVDDVAEVAVLSGRMCARRRDGDVWCWVEGHPPERVAELGRARRIVGGYTFACVIGDDDHTHCISWWTGKDNVPAYQVFDITDAAGAIQLGATYNGACAVLRTGAVTCWNLVDTSGPPTLTMHPEPNIATAIDVALGMRGGCVALRDGSVTCFTSIGEPPKTAAWAADVRAIAIGNEVMCGAPASGEITCWGTGNAPLGRYPTLVEEQPAEIAALADVAEVALEDDQACARRSDGTVACWMNGKALERIDVAYATHVVAGHRFACAGVGGDKRACWGTVSWEGCQWRSHDNCQPTHLVKPMVVQLFDMPNVKAIADPCAIDASGHVQCRIVSTHVAQTVAIPGIDGATSISPRCAVMRGGRVACWIPGDKPTVTVVDGIANAVQVVAGARHDCALLATGTVQCWGANGQGQLGDGTHHARDKPTAVEGVSDAVELAAGDAFTCARDKRGAVACWGSNAGGALGGGDRDRVRAEPVAKLGDAIAVRAAAQHACVVRKGGKVTCWGYVAGMPLGADTHATVLDPDVLD